MYDTWLGEHVDYHDPDEPDDGPAECGGCHEIFPESALAGNGLCRDCDALKCMASPGGGCERCNPDY